MERTWMKKLSAVTAALLVAGLMLVPTAGAVSMADYTNTPLFQNATVPPNILFIVDFSDAMLPAAFGAYPLSYSTATGNCANYCSNYAGAGLTVTDTEIFDSSKTYFGLFDSFGCYSLGTNTFDTRVAKAAITTACASGKWDGNFLNWLSNRKIDLAKKVMIGGRTISASNNDGTANSLLGEPKTGQNGSTNTCNNTSNPCYRYVKFVRASSLTGRYNTALSAADTAWQATGTVTGPGSVTTAGTAVAASATVSGTTFLTTFAVNDFISIGGVSRQITAIASNSQLTVASAFSSSAVSNSGYIKNLVPGTVEVQAGSLSIVRGTGTAFQASDVGRIIKIGTVASEITTFTSSTQVTVTPAFSAAIAAGTSYSFYDPASANGPGTVTTGSGANANKATGSSTQFKNGPYNFVVNDIIKINAATPQIRIVTSTPNNDTALTATANFSPQISSATTYKKFTAAATTVSGPGTVDVVANSTTVNANATISPTTFTTTFHVGDTIQVGTVSPQSRTITAIASDSALTVDTAFSPDFATGQTYFNVSASLEGPGTVSATGTTTVTGSGTNFLTRFAIGEKIRIGGTDYTISAIASDTSLTTTAAVTTISGSHYNGPDGVYFGSGEGTIFVNGDATANPFDAANSRQFNIKVDLTAETTAFRQQQSLGLLQNLRTDNMRVAVMFTNSDNGKAATLFRPFDGVFNASAITGIRNQSLSQFAALAESTYEALCYYRNSQGPCYNNNPADFSASVGAAGDPFFFVSNNQTVGCCKSFILMISSGFPTGDGNAPDSVSPFGNLMSTGVSNVGLTTTQLDDVAYYGQTHDIRNQGAGVFGDVPNTQKVTFYSVNAMGGASGAAILSSASKFGGFEDQNGNNIPDATGQTCTFPSGSNLGTGSSTSSPEWDLDKDCTPDTFFDASDGGDLEAQINKAIADILKRAASGTAVSVLATSSTGEGAIYQAYYLPETQVNDGTTNVVHWLGFTQGLFVDAFGNIREDSDGDHRLVLTKDKIIITRFNTTTNNVEVIRCPDVDGDGIADAIVSSDPTVPIPSICETVTLQAIKPIWDAGTRLSYTNAGASCTTAQAGVTCRQILTWIDRNNDKAVGTVDTAATAAATAEVIQLTVGNVAALCPYFGGPNVGTCVSGGAGGAGQTEATNYINFHRGWDGTTENAEIAGFRSRKYLTTNPDGGASQQRVSKLGDVVYSTPTIVGAPRERYDVIYGDATYATYFQQYQTRRQVAYVGANDGMLHAFNAGFFTAGDDPNPIPAGTPGAGTNPVEHGFFNTTAPSSVTSYTTPRGGSPKMGAELWAFVPQELLPHLKWLTDPSYTHVSYVDLRPKVTDVRIFCGDTTTAPNGSPSPCINGQTGVSHPGGWGTIVIAGMRYGGSCGACTNVSGTNGGGPAMTVTADFGSGTTTRTFYSSYVVLDVTDPEKDPALLWTFTDSTLGLTTSVPAVLRVSPAADAKTDNTNAKWMVVFGSGPTAYTGDSTQAAKFYVVDLIAGPTYTAGAFTGQTYATSDISTTASGCTASVPCGSFMSDIITVDANLDYRVDIIYAGDTISNGSSSPPYIGKLYRITTGASTDVTTWGVLSGSARIPTVLISTFPTAGTTKVGPITSAPATSSDTLSNIWVFFGTGRYFSLNDKTDTTTQYFFGVKDSCATSTSCTQTTQRNNLVDVSSAVVCSVCATGTNQVTGVTGSTTVDQLGTTLEATNIDGWFTSLLTSPPTPATAQGERVLSTPTVLGGTIFFSTFIPSTDICVAAGSGYLYALYYLTGTAYSQSAIGTTTVGGNTNVNRSISLGTGLPSQMAVQMGSKGSGTEGSAGGGAGCKSGTTLIYQTSTGALGQNCGKTALTSYSRMISWRDL